MKPGMYIFVNKGLGMSPGKIAAQAGHAAVEAYRLSNQDEDGRRLLRAWYTGGHYTKYVMEARDSEHLCMIERYLTARDFKTYLVIDEGHTEVQPITATALGVAIVDKDDPHTAATFSSFKLYRDQTFQEGLELGKNLGRVGEMLTPRWRDVDPAREVLRDHRDRCEADP